MAVIEFISIIHVNKCAYISSYKKLKRTCGHIFFSLKTYLLYNCAEGMKETCKLLVEQCLINN